MPLGNKVQPNINKKLDEIMVHEQNENINKKEKKNQTKILELKNSVNEMKNELQSNGNKADWIKDRINLEIIPVGEEEK